MKLIDLLVQELPNRGGWPEGVIKMSQDYDKEVWAWFGNDYASVKSLGRYRELSDNHRKQSHDEEPSHFVTREQYEAALAASKPQWDGDGLPPVGAVAEVSVDGGRSWCSYKALSESNGMRLVEIGDFTEEFQTNNYYFRPMRSEADKKKESIIAEISKHLEMRPNGKRVSEFYDAIAAGKIPGIKLED